ncbi:TonB-dependent receptor plug domain-containing protein, partial [Bacteroides ovatus]
MLVLNFMYMKKSLFRFSSRRILFSTVIASALIAGGSQAVFADAGEVQVVLQTGTIKGKIVDSNGEPVIGANVMVKGTTNGCMTDIDGNFSLKDAKGTLVISYIGYKTEEVQVKGHETSLKIVLKEDSELLLEVVVVGYGSMKKESLTGSVTVVDQKLFKDKGTVSNPLSAMQGQVPGLRITRSSAAPGEEGWGVSIRGSVSKNKVEPLLIIDGVPASGVSEIAQLNADDIETINFLK